MPRWQQPHARIGRSCKLAAPQVWQLGHLCSFSRVFSTPCCSARASCCKQSPTCASRAPASSQETTRGLPEQIENPRREVRTFRRSSGRARGSPPCSAAPPRRPRPATPSPERSAAPREPYLVAQLYEGPAASPSCSSCTCDKDACTARNKAAAASSASKTARVAITRLQHLCVQEPQPAYRTTPHTLARPAGMERRPSSAEPAKRSHR